MSFIRQTAVSGNGVRGCYFEFEEGSVGSVVIWKLKLFQNLILTFPNHCHFAVIHLIHQILQVLLPLLLLSLLNQLIHSFHLWLHQHYLPHLTTHCWLIVLSMNHLTYSR